MNRNEFLLKMGVTVLVIPTCLGGLTGCTPTSPFPTAPTNVDFTIDVSTGTLTQNGSYVVKNGIVIAKTLAGSFLAVSAACTHQGTTVEYIGAQNEFYCPRHGAVYGSKGQVLGGPTNQALTQYNTTLTGASLRIFS